ncbi:MAG: M23 family metallopeptidase [Clostridiales Family XIII bacterium]|jgi:murein DD-endopeptidase MepM/ murein hydrolase activator NlpD|nr:M23 family metallopeptidase [Clostridiales Family XIII bacterium]
MKKILISILIVLLVAATGVFGYAAYAYITTDEGSAPHPSVEIMGIELAPVSILWNEPVLRGALYKDVSREETGLSGQLGEIGLAPLPLRLSLPEGFENTVYLSDGSAADGQEAASRAVPPGGQNITGRDDVILAEGIYTLEIVCAVSQTGGNGYGSIRYSCSFEVGKAPDPELSIGKYELKQGEILPLLLTGVPEGVKPEAETELGMTVFTPDGGGSWFAAAPIGNSQAPGRYNIKIKAGGWETETEITVITFEFAKQNLIIDTSNPTISEANSPAAYQEYREKIPPLFETFDEERHWSGVFETPAKGRVSTEFGTIRYTNGDYSNSRSHNGMDIAAPTGTPVYAPNAGRVVMAERLLNTGNTLVIEHGGGLKTYYFHLSKLNAAPGDMVEKGDLLGEVGSTGYSTGAHLHYEMRIGSQPVSPSMLFDENASLYSLETIH